MLEGNARSVREDLSRENLVYGDSRQVIELGCTSSNEDLEVCGNSIQAWMSTGEQMLGPREGTTLRLVCADKGSNTPRGDVNMQHCVEAERWDRHRWSRNNPDAPSAGSAGAQTRQ